MGTKIPHATRIHTAILITLVALFLPASQQLTSAAVTVTLTVDTIVDSSINSGCLDAIDDDTCSLRGAIALANADVVGNDYHIDIPIGVYLLDLNSSQPTEDLNASGDLDILNALVTLHGESMLLTIIDGNLTDRVIDQLSGNETLSLSTLTIRNGRLDSGEGGGGGIRVATGNTLNLNSVKVTGNGVTGEDMDWDNGGGIFGTSAATLNLLHSLIKENFACNGGGIATWENSLLILSSDLEDNFTTCEYGLGGGVSVSNGGTTSVLNTTFDGNQALRGAGLFNGSTAILNINNSTFSYNNASLHGGGLNLFGEVTVSNSTFHHNQAANYGGALVVEGDVALENVTFAANTAATGAGIAVMAGTGIFLDMAHVSFAANTASTAASVLYSGAESAVTVTSSILASPLTTTENCFINASTGWVSGGYNISNDSSCQLSETGDWVNTNPQLGTLGNYGGPTLTLPLLTGSPAIDLGNPADTSDRLDQRGYSLFDGDGNGTKRSDIGAFEYPIIVYFDWLPFVMK